MPGNANGSLDGIALKPLTVAFHEPGFIATLQAENQQPFWFMMSAEQRQQAGNPMGPANPQALNRYSYVLNSPLRYTDPSGHGAVCTKDFSACNGARVVNNSSHSILVKGDMLLANGDVLNDKIFRLEPGQSSISIGIFDVDEIFVDSVPIDGYGFGYGTKLQPGTTTTVEDDANGTLTIGRKDRLPWGIMSQWYRYPDAWGGPDALRNGVMTNIGVDMSGTRHVTGAEALWAYVDAEFGWNFHHCEVPGACARVP